MEPFMSAQAVVQSVRPATKRLAGKVAVVTGASKGIGAAIARQLAVEGASVIVNYASSREGAERVVNEIIAQGGQARAIKGDVARSADVSRLFTETVTAFGQVDVLVNNAGVYEFAPLEGITEEHFHKQFDVNVLGLLLASQEAAKRFGPDGGSIINISSVVSTLAPPNASVYSATKGAVDAVTRSLASELGPRRIRVNAINPGLIETEGTHAVGVADADSDFRKDAERTTPLGRIGQPDDIASVAVFLASPESAWVTGETLRTAGGRR
jgi:3-oxoacyl-[acyl-carrier protein] reductase